MSKYDDDLIIRLKEHGKTWAEIGEAMDASAESVRWYARQQDWYDTIKNDAYTPQTNDNNSDNKNYRKDGSISSEIKTRVNQKKPFTHIELLELHALNPKEFQIRTITSNEWSMTNADGETYWNFQSKIIAEPKTETISPEYIEGLFENVRPEHVDLILDEIPPSDLLIPLGDLHWGLNYAEDYIQLKADIMDRIIEGHSEILIVLGGDYFHVDNFMNTTEKGTRIDDVDVERATHDAYVFLIDLLNCALANSPYVKLVYLPGNHAPMVDYMFMQGIRRLFPQVEVDDEIKDFKHAWLGNHSIFLHHGDKIKNRAKLLEYMVGTFAKEWGESKSRYLITFHFHHEKSLSTAGMTHYQMQSPSEYSTYDKRQGYTTSEPGLMLFEFDDIKRRAIYYL